MAEQQTPDEDAQAPATREFLELKLAGFKSEMRMLFVIAIAGNQLLAHISLSPAVGYIGSGLAIVGALAAKFALVR